MHPDDTTTTRVAIVGGGPIGLSLAVACSRHDIPFELVEAQQVGYTMSWWAPGTRWFSSNERISIAGVPLETPDQAKATREQYLTYLRSVIHQFGLRIRSYEPAVDLQRQGDHLVLTTAPRGGQRRIVCQAVVLAIGGTDTPRALGIEGEDLPHVDGYFREPHIYFGRRLLIIGGRNSAVEAALRAHHTGAQVTLSYRGPHLPRESIKYWLLPEIEGLIGAGRIEAHFATRPLRITPTHVTLERLAGADSSATYDVPAEDVLSLIGYEQDKRLLRRAGIQLVGPSLQPQFDPQTMETNVRGVYVAGTAVAGTQSSKYKIFLENCHIHVDRILAHLEGREPPAESALDAPTRALLEQIEAQPES